MNNKVIGMYVYWRDTTHIKEFVIMWSDNTWETIRCPFTEYYINGKSFKQYMELQKLISSKATKEAFMKHIQKKFEDSFKLPKE